MIVDNLLVFYIFAFSDYLTIWLNKVCTLAQFEDLILGWIN